MDPLALHVAFRAGFRWPLRAGDVVELWNGMTMVGSITADLVIHLVAHHYTGVRMQEQMRAELTGRLEVPAYEVPRMPPKAVPVTREKMAARRAGRRARKRASSSPPGS